jgi:hypothetical protein
MTKPSWPMYDPFEASSAFQKCPLMHTHARTRDINNAFCQSLWLLQQPKPSKHAFGGFGLHLVQLQLGTISNNQVPTIREQWCTSYTSRHSHANHQHHSGFLGPSDCCHHHYHHHHQQQQPPPTMHTPTKRCSVITKGLTGIFQVLLQLQTFFVFHLISVYSGYSVLNHEQSLLMLPVSGAHIRQVL